MTKIFMVIQFQRIAWKKRVLQLEIHSHRDLLHSFCGVPVRRPQVSRYRLRTNKNDTLL